MSINSTKEKLLKVLDTNNPLVETLIDKLIVDSRLEGLNECNEWYKSTYSNEVNVNDDLIQSRE